MKNIIFMLLIIVLFISACENTNQALSPSVIDCQKSNGSYQILTNPDGSQTGKCILPNGNICTDEQYFQTAEGCYPNQIFKKEAK